MTANGTVTVTVSVSVNVTVNVPVSVTLMIMIYKINVICLIIIEDNKFYMPYIGDYVIMVLFMMMM